MKVCRKPSERELLSFLFDEMKSQYPSCNFKEIENIKLLYQIQLLNDSIYFIHLNKVIFNKWGMKLTVDEMLQYINKIGLILPSRSYFFILLL